MTPKEKAIELIEAMAFSCIECDYEAKAKQCALILVDEILKITSESYDIDHINWWKEVKQEIENL
jgi:hypothetical protein